MNITLRQLRYLVAVAEVCHFGKAAEACFVSQPALSTQIQALEETLGTSLIERNKQRVLVTALGEEIVARARQILREVEDLSDLARGGTVPLTTPLRMGVIPTISPYILPGILPSLRKQYPHLKLILQEDKTEELLRRLRDGKIDLALLALPVEGHDLISQPLIDEPFMLAVPNNHPLARHQQIDGQALKGQEILLLEDGHCLRDHALEVCHLRGAREHSVIQAGSLGTLVQMVANGLGITLLPIGAIHVEVHADCDIITLPFKSPTPKRQLGFVWRNTSSRAHEFHMLLAFFRPLAEKMIGRS